MLCVTVSLAHAAQRGKGGAKPGGGRSNEGQAERERQGRAKSGTRNQSATGRGRAAIRLQAENGRNDRTAGNRRVQQGNEHEHAAGAGAAANKNKTRQPSGAGAATGAAVQNRKSPQATGAQGAAAGAAASNRKFAASYRRTRAPLRRRVDAAANRNAPAGEPAASAARRQGLL